MAFIAGAIIIILFSRKDKEVFLEDRFPTTPETKNTADVPRHIKGISNMPVTISAPQILHLPPEQPSPIPPPTFATPKLNAVLGWQDGVDYSYAKSTQPAPRAHQSYYPPPRSHYDMYDSDDETLKDDEKNSAYVPYPRSDASGGVRFGGASKLGVSDRAHMYDGDSMVRRSPLSLASKTGLGDAY